MMISGHLRIFVTLNFLSGMSSSLVDTLFRDRIDEARCQSTCLASETNEARSQCEEVCGILSGNTRAGEDLCSMTSLCYGGCGTACDAEVTRMLDTVTRITGAKMESCELSWDLDTETGDVVFIVAGRDQAGMWSLVRDAVMDTRLEFSPALATRMAEVVVFAVTWESEVVDKLRLDISDNTCEETVPEPREWREEEKEGTNANYILLVSFILATVSVIIILFIVTLIIVKMRRTQSEAAHYYNTIPYTSYTFPSPVLAQENFYHKETNTFILNQESGEENDNLWTPRQITTIVEEDEYEDFD